MDSHPLCDLDKPECIFHILRNLVVDCIFRFLHVIEYFCWGQVEAHVTMYTEEAEEQLLGGNPDFVLDAIDNIDTKVH